MYIFNCHYLLKLRVRKKKIVDLKMFFLLHIREFNILKRERKREGDKRKKCENPAKERKSEGIKRLHSVRVVCEETERPQADQDISGPKVRWLLASPDKDLGRCFDEIGSKNSL